MSAEATIALRNENWLNFLLIQETFFFKKKNNRILKVDKRNFKFKRTIIKTFKSLVIKLQLTLI